MQYRWTDGTQSENHKTGKIPTAFPADATEAWESCTGCVLRDRRRTGTAHRPPQQATVACYFWTGATHLAIRRLAAAEQRGRAYTLERALAGRRGDARAVRMSQGGDPNACDRTTYRQWRDTVQALGLAWLDYTHFWRSKGGWLQGMAMASCDTWAEAVAAVQAGWRAAVHVDALQALQGTVAGIKYTLCPAQRKKGVVTCNTCRLCDASRDVVPIIVFLNT